MYIQSFVFEIGKIKTEYQYFRLKRGKFYVNVGMPIVKIVLF